MRIVIDLQCLQTSSRYRGIGHYASALVRKMLQLNRASSEPHEILLLLNSFHLDVIRAIRRDWQQWLDPGTIRVFHGIPGSGELIAPNPGIVYVNEYLRNDYIERLEPDFVLILSLFEGVVDDFACSIPAARSYAAGVIGYDLIPLTSPEEYLSEAVTRRWYHRKLDSLRRADRIFAISESARQEFESLLKLAPGITKTISSACDEAYHPLDDESVDTRPLKSLGINRPFLLYSGAADERKNLKRLLEAYGRLDPSLRKDMQLVLVGKFNETEQLRLVRFARKCGVPANDLICTGFVSQATLNLLYNRCELFVFPSLHEGFGLPVLEAITCGAPVICSNTTSLPEVVDLPEATFDPLNVDEMSALIQRVLTDGEFRQRLIDYGKHRSTCFSWADTAATVLTEIPRAVWPSGDTPRTASDDASARARNIARLLSDWNMEDGLVRQAANCMAANDMALNQRHPAANYHWRIEGPFDSSYSLALLNRETARGLAALGQQVSLHSTEGPGDFEPSPDFLAHNPDLAAMHRSGRDPEGPTADIITRNLYPPRVHDIPGDARFLHLYAWEESGFPREWVSHFNQHLTGLTCLSEHVRKVLIDNGVCLPMAVSGCGVDHWDRVEPEPMKVGGRSFRFLHVSSCFPRKGIEALLEAWGQAFTDQDDVSLIIKTFENPHNRVRELLAAHQEKNPGYPHVDIIMEDLPHSQLRYLYEHCHALVAPSCAEGFGLPLAEAMLSGLPVITTAWSGQLDFCTAETAWLVDYRFARADTHFQLYDSVWAEPDVNHLAETLRQLPQADSALVRDRTAAAISLLRERFCWDQVALRLVTQVEDIRQKAVTGDLDRPLNVGWVSTWNQKCGIAAYSRHLIEHNAVDRITVFAPEQQGVPVTPDEAFVHRCWRQDNEDSLERLGDALLQHSLDAVVIQMNYYFYDYDALEHLITRLERAGIVVTLTLHSTVDPEPVKALSNLRRGLELVERVIVHTPADLNRLVDAGINDNTVLMPHGVAEYQPQTVNCRSNTKRCIASYGFALPHKGLEQLLEAFASLRESYPELELLLLNAEHTDPSSAAIVQTLHQRIEKLGLGEHVRAEHGFLPDADSLELLSQADVIAMPYQGTGESSSAAVRTALASGTPVMVTPLPIFDDVAEAVDRFEGTDVESIRRGLAKALEGQLQQTPEGVNNWKQAHSYPVVSRRLFDMLRSLWINQ